MSKKYTSQELKIKILRVLAIVLASAFVLSAALFGISVWERYNGNFLGMDSESLEGSIFYNGNKYILKEINKEGVNFGRGALLFVGKDGMMTL